MAIEAFTEWWHHGGLWFPREKEERMEVAGVGKKKNNEMDL